MKIFLDSELSSSERNEDARFHVVPMPLEKTVSFGSGTQHGPEAILETSDQLERWDGHDEPCKHGIFTHAPINCEQPIEAAIADLEAKCAEIAKAGKIPSVLGGEHSLSYGSVRGTQAAYSEPVGIIQIDAHADLRVSYQGHKHSHASVMHLLCSEGFKLAQYGVRALCKEEQDAREPYGVTYIDGEAMEDTDIAMLSLPADFPKKVFISFDVDGLDPSIMPATGTPVPGGLGFYQSIKLIKQLCKDREIVGFDVVELAPIDGAEAWDFTAALLVYRLMGLAA